MLLLPLSGYGQQILPRESFRALKDIVDLKPGELVYVDFWASWCKPCRKSFPWMNAMQVKYQAQGLKVLAINVDKDRSLADDFLARVPTNVQIHYDPKGKLAGAFKLKGMPSSFVIDDRGRIQISHKGFFEKNTDAYEQALLSVLPSNTGPKR